MSTPTPQTWRIDDFSGGEGDGFVKGPAGSFRYGENLDVSSYDGGIKLCNAGTFAFDYTWDVLAISPVPSTLSPSSIVYSTLNWTTSQIFVDTDNTVDVLAWGPAIQNKVMGFFSEYNSSLGYSVPYGISDLYLGVGKIHRFSQDYTWVFTNVGTFTMPLARNRGISYPPSVVYSAWGVIIGFGNWIWEILQGIPTLKVSLPENADIVGITLYQDTYRVYFNTNDSYSNTDSYVAYWDWDSLDLTSITKYEKSKITAVYANAQYDYIVVNGTDLYAVGGLVRSIVRSSTISASENSRVLKANWTVVDGTICFPAQFKNDSIGIYEYGDYYVGTKKALTPSFSVSTNVSFAWSSFFVTYRNWVRYVFLNNVEGAVGKVYSIPSAFTAPSVNSGYLITYPIEGAIGRYSKKKLERLRVSYIGRGEGFSISVYARINSTPETTLNSGWVLLKTIGDNSSQSSLISEPEISATWLGFFNSLELKAVMNKSTSTGYSPILSSIDVDYVDFISD